MFAVLSYQHLTKWCMG